MPRGQWHKIIFIFCSWISEAIKKVVSRCARKCELLSGFPFEHYCRNAGRNLEFGMANRRRIALSLFVIAVCLLAASVLLAPVLFNLDRYRPEVISYFEENTGKKVEIGRLGLTLFPKVTIHIDRFGAKSPPLFPPVISLKLCELMPRLT